MYNNNNHNLTELEQPHHTETQFLKFNLLILLAQATRYLNIIESSSIFLIKILQKQPHHTETQLLKSNFSTLFTQATRYLNTVELFSIFLKYRDATENPGKKLRRQKKTL